MSKYPGRMLTQRISKDQRLWKMTDKSHLIFLHLIPFVNSDSTLPKNNEHLWGLCVDNIKVSLEDFEIAIKEAVGVGVLLEEETDYLFPDFEESNHNLGAVKMRRFRSKQSVTVEVTKVTPVTKSHLVSSLVSSFNLFYKGYPRHEGKEAGLKAWKKLNPSEALIKILLAAVEKGKKTIWLNKENQYIPLPASWLNGKRWEDDINYSPSKPKVVDEPAYFAPAPNYSIQEDR